MPTNQTPDDAELSRLLSQAEPPRSPEHVDEAILQYARENTPPVEKESTWFPRPWAAAVATLSVAAIAVSVSITSFNNGDLERAVSVSSESDLVRMESSDAPLAQSFELDDALPVEEERNNVDADLNRERQVAQNIASQNTVAAEPAVAGAGIASVAALAEANANDAQLTPETLVAEEELEVAFAAAAPTALSQAQAPEPVDANVGRLEDAVAATSAASAAAAQSGLANTTAQQALRRSTNTAARSQALSSQLSESVTDPIDLPGLLTVLENLLNEQEVGVGVGVGVGAREDADQVIDAGERASQLLQRFNGIDDEEVLQQLDASYAELRGDFTDFELPESFASAVAAVQQLSN